MDSDNQPDPMQAQYSDIERRRRADEGKPLPGFTAPVPNDVARHIDQPVQDIEPTPAGQLVPVPVETPPRRQRLNLIRIMFSSPKSRLGLAIVLVFVLAAVFAPVIAPGDPQEFVDAPNLPPSAQYFFGTDGSGKDVFRQTVWGARLSLTVGFGSAALVTLISTVVGVTAGYFRGRVDDMLSFLMNLFLVMPALPLLIVISGYLKPGTLTIILVIAMVGWAFGARIMRAQALSLREKDFVAAAQVSGQSDWGIIFKQIVPNMVNIIAGSFIGGVSAGIAAVTALSFLGLTDLNEVNWGTNLFWAQANSALLLGAWWTFVPSGLAVALTAFGLALINYGMDEVTNPRLRAERELSNVVKNTGAQRVRATPVVPRAH